MEGNDESGETIEVQVQYGGTCSSILIIPPLPDEEVERALEILRREFPGHEIS